MGSQYEPFDPSPVTLEAIRGVMTEFGQPVYPNSLYTIQPRVRVPRRVPLPPVEGVQLFGAEVPPQGRSPIPMSPVYQASPPHTSPQPGPSHQFNPPPNPSTSSNSSSPTPSNPSTNSNPSSPPPPAVSSSTTFTEGQLVNVVKRKKPYLAAIVVRNDGDTTTVNFPFKQRKSQVVVSSSCVRLFEPQIKGDEVVLLKNRGKGTDRNDKKTVRDYETKALSFLALQKS